MAGPKTAFWPFSTGTITPIMGGAIKAIIDRCLTECKFEPPFVVFIVAEKTGPDVALCLETLIPVPPPLFVRRDKVSIEDLEDRCRLQIREPMTPGHIDFGPHALRVLGCVFARKRQIELGKNFLMPADMNVFRPAPHFHFSNNQGNDRKVESPRWGIEVDDKRRLLVGELQGDSVFGQIELDAFKSLHDGTKEIANEK